MFSILFHLLIFSITKKSITRSTSAINPVAYMEITTKCTSWLKRSCQSISFSSMFYVLHTKNSTRTTSAINLVAREMYIALMTANATTNLQHPRRNKCNSWVAMMIFVMPNQYSQLPYVVPSVLGQSTWPKKCVAVKVKLLALTITCLKVLCR